MSNDSTFNQLLVKFGLDVLTGNKNSAQTAVESIVDVIGTGSAEGSGGIHREGGGVREAAGRPNPSKSSNPRTGHGQEEDRSRLPSRQIPQRRECRNGKTVKQQHHVQICRGVPDERPIRGHVCWKVDAVGTGLTWERSKSRR